MIMINHLPFKVIHWNIAKEHILPGFRSSLEFFGFPIRNEYTMELIGFRMRWTMRFLDNPSSYIAEDSYQVSKPDIMQISETDFMDIATNSFMAFTKEYSKRMTELGFPTHGIANNPLPREETLVLLYEMQTKW